MFRMISWGIMLAIELNVCNAYLSSITSSLNLKLCVKALANNMSIYEESVNKCSSSKLSSLRGCSGNKAMRADEWYLKVFRLGMRFVNTPICI